MGSPASGVCASRATCACLLRCRIYSRISYRNHAEMCALELICGSRSGRASGGPVPTWASHATHSALRRCCARRNSRAEASQCTQHCSRPQRLLATMRRPERCRRSPLANAGCLGNREARTRPSLLWEPARSSLQRTPPPARLNLAGIAARGVVAAELLARARARAHVRARTLVYALEERHVDARVHEVQHDCR